MNTFPKISASSICSAASRARSWVTSMRGRAVLSLGVVTILASGGTLAYWSDSVAVAASTLSTGSIDLKVNDLDAVTGSSTLALADMVPGNSSARVLKISNAGRSPLTYTLTAAGTNADTKNLVGGLAAKVVLLPTGTTLPSGAAPALTCPGTALASSGTSFTGNLIAPANKRTLAVGAAEYLCIQATLPTEAPTTLQNATTNVTFTAQASQVGAP